MAKMSQTDVFQEIILERIYQDSKWGTIEDHPHEVGSWLVIMDRLLAKAKNGYMTSVGDYTALNEIRQIVAVGIACMEQHGVPSRIKSRNANVEAE